MGVRTYPIRYLPRCYQSLCLTESLTSSNVR